MTSMKLKLQRAKRTKLGRFLCAIMGDQCGAVAMEYVVIALLVAAAVVGIVMVFGSRIANMFTQSTKALATEEKGMEALAKEVQDSKATDIERVEAQQKHGDTIRGTGEGGESAGDPQ